MGFDFSIDESSKQTQSTVAQSFSCTLSPPSLSKSTTFLIAFFFGRFSIHEHGTHDLPASLSACLSVTGSKTLSYVGHSMGTTTFLAMCSSKAPIAKQVDLAILLAPVVEPCKMRNIAMQVLAPAYSVFMAALETIGIQEIIPDWTPLQKLITVPWLQFLFAVL